MKKMLTAGALALSVLLVVSSAQAETVDHTGKYTGAPIGVGLHYPLGDPDLGDFGGTSFTVEGLPVSVAIADMTGSDVAFTVAQDLDNDTTAGEAGIEPSVAGCGTSGSLTGSAIPFQDGAPIIVFVRTAARVGTASGVNPCPGAATQGTITLTTELA